MEAVPSQAGLKNEDDDGDDDDADASTVLLRLEYVSAEKVLA